MEIILAIIFILLVPCAIITLIYILCKRFRKEIEPTTELPLQHLGSSHLDFCARSTITPDSDTRLNPSLQNVNVFTPAQIQLQAEIQDTTLNDLKTDSE